MNTFHLVTGHRKKLQRAAASSFLINLSQVFNDFYNKEKTTRQVYNGQLILFQQKEKIFWSKMIFEQKKFKKCINPCIIDD